MNLIDIYETSEGMVIGSCRLEICDGMVWKGTYDAEGYLNVLTYKDDELVSGVPARYQAEIVLKTDDLKDVTGSEYAKILLRRHIEDHIGIGSQPFPQAGGSDPLAELDKMTKLIGDYEKQKPFTDPYGQPWITYTNDVTWLDNKSSHPNITLKYDTSNAVSLQPKVGG